MSAVLSASFQSHNGAIAAKALLLIIQRCQVVSIPQWCDCCSRMFTRLSHAQSVSIPQWCDCCEPEVYSHESVSVVSIPQWCDCCLHFSGFSVKLQNKFQSHNGAIAALHRNNSVGVVDSFNPTMVRLLQLLVPPPSGG